MKVKAYVHVHDADGRRHAFLAPGEELPEWADVTNPAVLGEADEAASAPVEEHEEPKHRAPRRRKPAASE